MQNSKIGYSKKKAAATQELFEFLRNASTEVVAKASALLFDKDDPQHLLSLCLYGTILDIVSSSQILLENRQVTSVLILLRSLLEAHADFLIATTDSSYYKTMYATFVKQKMKLFESASENKQNPYLKQIVQKIDIKKQRHDLKMAYDQLTSSSARGLSVKERFERAKLKDQYQAVYWHLCLHTHNNLSALEDRHIETNGDDFRLVFLKTEQFSDIARCFDTLIGILLDSSLKIHQLLQSPFQTEVEELCRKSEILRDQYGAPKGSWYSLL